jgi:O-antigen/teichoic acid export membrane protein
MQILAIEAILFSIRVVSGPVVNAMGRPGWVLGFSGCEAVAGVALVWFAAPYGVLAVAGAALVRAALILPFFLFAIRRLIGISVLRLLAPYAMPFLCSAAMVGCIVALRDVLADVHVWVRLVVAVVSGGTVYLLAVRFLAPAHMEQMQDLARRALPASIRPKSRAG